MARCVGKAAAIASAGEDQIADWRFDCLFRLELCVLVPPKPRADWPAKAWERWDVWQHCRYLRHCRGVESGEAPGDEATYEGNEREVAD